MFNQIFKATIVGFIFQNYVSATEVSQNTTGWGWKASRNHECPDGTVLSGMSFQHENHAHWWQEQIRLRCTNLPVAATSKLEKNVNEKFKNKETIDSDLKTLKAELESKIELKSGPLSKELEDLKAEVKKLKEGLTQGTCTGPEKTIEDVKKKFECLKADIDKWQKGSLSLTQGEAMDKIRVLSRLLVTQGDKMDPNMHRYIDIIQDTYPTWLILEGNLSE